MDFINQEGKKYLAIGALILALVGAAYFFGKTKFDESYKGVKAQIDSQSAFTPTDLEGNPSMYGSDLDVLRSTLSQITSEFEDIVGRVNSAKGEKSGVLSQQDLLLFLGYETKNELNLTRFKEITNTVDGGIYKGSYEIELNGFYPALLRFTQDLDSLGVYYNIKKMSVRVNSYKELTGGRAYDNNSLLEWYDDNSQTSLDLDAQLQSDAEATKAKNAMESITMGYVIALFILPVKAILPPKSRSILALSLIHI